MNTLTSFIRSVSIRAKLVPQQDEKILDITRRSWNLDWPIVNIFPHLLSLYMHTCTRTRHAHTHTLFFLFLAEPFKVTYSIMTLCYYICQYLTPQNMSIFYYHQYNYPTQKNLWWWFIIFKFLWSLQKCPL